ncbi:MAG TPA: diaminopimelate decarboxylase [Rhodothermales bacterium]|nr:diaminopimelate decarboxylase [Rhodothermales bacterium]
MSPTLATDWWLDRADSLRDLAQTGTPRYVYAADILRRQARSLRTLGVFDRVLYAVKANAHPGVLGVFHEEGLGFECVSPAEVKRVLGLFPDLDRRHVLFTPNFVPREEYEWALAEGVRVTVDNLYPLEAWPEVFAGREVFVRLDPGQGRGHHDHVRTAGRRSKFGIDLDDLGRLAEAVREAGVRVTGLHAHVGSGVDAPDSWAETAEVLAAAAEWFPDVRVLDLGGGLPVPSHPGAPPFDLERAATLLHDLRQRRPDFQFWTEPGRFLAAESGVLLCRVTQTKDKGGVRYVGLDAGMNTLVRPAMYGAHHPIANLSRLGEEALHPTEVVGMICESGDAFGHDIPLPETREGDVIAIGTVGAYGASMASHYNLREPATESLLD